MSGRSGDPWEVRVYRALLRILAGRLFRLHGRAMASVLRDRLDEAGARRSLRRRLLAGALWDAARHGPAASAAIPRAGRGSRRALGVGVESALRDVRFALRSLLRRPLFAGLSVVTLALGIGGTTAIFSIVDGVLIKRLPYRDPDAVVSVWRAWPDWRGQEILDYVWDHIQFALEDYEGLRDGARTLTNVEAAVHRRVPLTSDGRTEEIRVGYATSGLFEMLGVDPVVGRTFVEGEALPAPVGARVALLSRQLWTRLFAADPSVVGRTISLGGESYEVVGVLPGWFRLPSDLVTINDNAGAADDGLREVWLPLGRVEAACGNCLEVLARLAPGHTLEEARAEARTFVTEGPAHQLARVEPRKAYLTRRTETPLLVLLMAAGILLAVACLNVAGLLAGEATGRQREIAVRRALGAGRGRVVRQLLTESALLGLLGAAGGVALAWLGTDALLAVAPPLPRLEEVGISGRVLAFAMASGLVTGLLFGLAPALGLVGGGPAPSGTRATRGSDARRFRAAVLTLQVGLTVTLLVAGGLFGRSLTRLMAVDPGFVPAGLATLSFTAPPGARGEDAGLSSLQSDVIDAVARLPGITAVTATDQLPFPGGHFSNGFRIERNGAPVGTTFWNRSVLPGYFETLGIPLLQGRLLSDADAPGAPDVIVVSRSLAERSWPGETPLGKVVTNGESSWTVVGVVGDVHQKTLGAAPQPTFYRSLLQRPRARLYLAARTAGDPAAVIPSMRRAIWALGPTTSITEAGVMTALIRDSEADDRFRALLMRTFAALATLLAAVGIFGVTARGVAGRTRELGIRAALGATGGGLVRLVVREGLTSAAAGVVLGSAGAWAAAAAVRHLLFGVDPHDPGIYARVVALALAVCVVAAWIPARRATRIDPRRAIAEE